MEPVAVIHVQLNVVSWQLSIMLSAAPPLYPAPPQVESLAGEVISRLASHPALLLPRAW